MSISRRKFTQTAGLAILGAGYAVSAGKAFSQSITAGTSLPGAATTDPVFYLSKEIFEPFIGTIFKSVQDGTGTSMRLVEVVDHKSREGKNSDATGECFSLVFRQVGRNVVKTDIHRFEHHVLGEFAILITPIDRAGKLHEAIINRLSR